MVGRGGTPETPEGFMTRCIGMRPTCTNIKCSSTVSREREPQEPQSPIAVAHRALSLLHACVDHSVHSPSRGTLLGVRRLFLRLLVGVSTTAVGSLERPAFNDSNLSTVIVICAAGRDEPGLLAGGAGAGGGPQRAPQAAPRRACAGSGRRVGLRRRQRGGDVRKGGRSDGVWDVSHVASTLCIMG